jgi:hypothetical protein
VTIDSTRFANLSLASKMKEEVKAPNAASVQPRTAEDVSADDYFDDLKPVVVPPTPKRVIDPTNVHPILDDDDEDEYEPKPTASPQSPAVNLDAGGKLDDEVTSADPRASRTNPLELTAVQPVVSKSYRRSRLTQTDRDLLEFLYEFGYASVSQFASSVRGQAVRGGVCCTIG